MKSPVKMMLPMVAFIFPVLFIILLGPVIVQLVSQFGK
jgi:tight adherence protein C